MYSYKVTNMIKINKSLLHLHGNTLTSQKVTFKPVQTSWWTGDLSVCGVCLFSGFLLAWLASHLFTNIWTLAIDIC